MKGLLLSAALCAALASCGPRAVDTPPASAAQVPAPAPAEPAKALDMDREKPADAMRKAADACADLTKAMDLPEDAPFYPLTWEQTETFLNRIAALGAPVTAYGHDMRNYEQAEAFARAAARGETAMTGIFTVSQSGLTLYTLARNDGAQMYQITSSYFPCEAVQEGPLEKTEDIRIQDGYLLYGKAEDESCNGFRVTPLGAEKRDACRKYVEPVYNSRGRLMQADWDGDDLSGLDMQYAFETLYLLDTGTALYDAGYPQNPQTFAYTVPGTEVRRILTRYLPVTEEWVLGLSGYDAAGDAFHWGCFAGGGYAPEPEVTDIRQNGDGTVTLLVNAVSVPSFGQTSGPKNELTLEIAADGSFRYLSNRLLELEQPAPAK